MAEKKVKRAGRKRRYTVYLLTPYCTWENVEASSKKEAIEMCQENSIEGVTRFVAMEEEQ